MAGEKTIALFGATGPTGRHIIEEALKQGYNLSVYTRDAKTLDPEQHHRVEAEAFKSANAGVRSVPHFVFGGSISINGGRSEDEIAAAIQAASGAISL